MSGAEKLSCPYCGANVPPLDARKARCLYCLNEVEVPAGFRQPLADARRLKAELEQSIGRLRGRRGEIRGQMLYAAGLALVYLCPLAFVARTALGSLAEGDPHYAFQVGFVGVGLYSVVFAAFASVALRWRSASVYRLAKLPTAALNVEDGLRAACPSCGAALATDAGELTERCGHCGTVSLLPAVHVSGRPQRQHAQVMAARVERGAMGKRFKRGERRGSLIVGWGLVVLGAGYAVMNPLWNAVLFPVRGLDTTGLLIGTLVFAGMFLFVGVVTVINSRE